MASRRVHIVFDLDDTLYSERLYAESSLRYMGRLIATAFDQHDPAKDLLSLFAAGEPNPIQTIWDRLRLPPQAMSDAIAAMRVHRPSLVLRDGARALMSALDAEGSAWSILTDGRSLTQRQKIAALDLNGAHGIYISEERGIAKPAVAAYTQIMAHDAASTAFVYVGDNPKKDFAAPNILGWHSIMLRDDGNNIHSQDCLSPGATCAQTVVENFHALSLMLEKI